MKKVPIYLVVLIVVALIIPVAVVSASPSDPAVVGSYQCMQCRGNLILWVDTNRDNSVYKCPWCGYSNEKDSAGLLKKFPDPYYLFNIYREKELKKWGYLPK